MSNRDSAENFNFTISTHNMKDGFKVSVITLHFWEI